MAGMQPFALCGKIAAAYCAPLAADGCPSSQIAIVTPSAVPLWKVIVGPRADELQPDSQGSGFSLGPLTAHACAAAGSVLLCCTGKREERRPMAWTTPTLVEICVGLEINGYLPAEF
jgi:coenzyme PQQ precursor peptide PqqA